MRKLPEPIIWLIFYLDIIFYVISFLLLFYLGSEEYAYIGFIGLSYIVIRLPFNKYFLTLFKGTIFR